MASVCHNESHLESRLKTADILSIHLLCHFVKVIISVVEQWLFNIYRSKNLSKTCHGKVFAPPVSNSDLRGMGLRPRISISSNATCDSDEVSLRPHLGKHWAILKIDFESASLDQYELCNNLWTVIFYLTI